MALWHYNNSPQRINLTKQDMGADAYLYLPGPSLKHVDFDVRIPGVVAFAVNTAYPKIKPNYWIGMDKPECYHPNLVNEGFFKIFRQPFAKNDFDGKKLWQHPMTLFADVIKPPKGVADMFLLKAPNISFAWFAHTLGVALHIMVWMGAKKIHFVGCDLGGETDYYDDRKLKPEHRTYNRRLYSRQASFLMEFAMNANKHGVELVSCTEDSPINKFIPFVPLSRALEASKSEEKKNLMPHVLEVREGRLKKQTEEIKWKKPIRERGVMVHCDKNQEWMLDWWWENYRAYNDFPVQFVDLGMTSEGAEFCKARGSYVKLSTLDLKVWFKKPFALKLTQFKRTLYVDLDCHIRGSVYDLFADFNGFTISRDKPNNFSTVKRPIQAGVILYDWGETIINEWCANTVKRYMKYRSDQDVLDHTHKTITELPHEYHWPRIMGENKRALIYHYTGTIGKKLIKQML